MNASPVLLPSGGLRRYRGEHEPHAHRHAQVLLGLEGCLDLDIEGRSARVDASTGLVVPAGMHHAFEARAGARVWVVDAPVQPGLDKLRGFALPAGWLAQTAPAQWPQLLALASDAPRALLRRRLETSRLASLVDEALHENWSSARMAAVFALSVPRFHARWRELTGLTPQAWLRQRRLEVAARWLQAGRPLEATALHIGYSSASALAFALRRDRAVSARVLRRR